MKSELLKDVLAEGDYSQFREELLAATLKEARGRRFGARQILAMAAGIAVVAGAVWMINSPAPAKMEPSIVARDQIPTIRTVPLRASQILETRVTPGLAFATDPIRSEPSITDGELLALFPKRAVGLFGRKFFFVNARDAKELMSSN